MAIANILPNRKCSRRWLRPWCEPLEHRWLLSGDIEQIAHLVASDAATEDNFGKIVAVSGHVAVVGARGNDDAGDMSGSAYVYEGPDWKQTKKLLPSDSQAKQQFGTAVAVSGETILVGGHGAGAAAYVFQRTEGIWTQQAKLRAGDQPNGIAFGFSVAISDDTIAVGARLEDSQGEDAGAAYVFARNGAQWTQQAKLTASDAEENDLFGYSVSISGDTIVVGARHEDEQGEDAGAAYVFRREGQQSLEEAKLTASDGRPGDDFGFKVAASGDTVAVSARFHDRVAEDTGNNTGAAYVFVRDENGWTRQQKLTGGNGHAVRFGFSIAMSGDRLAVGETGDDEAAKNAGAVRLFERDKGVWSELDKLTIADGQEEDAFGFSVAISDKIVVGGAEFDDTTEVDTGSAYVFRIGPPPLTTINVDQFVVGDGSPQRSRVRQLTIGFDAEVTLGDDAIIVQQVGGDVVDTEYFAEVVDGKTVATVILGDLADGNYEVRVKKDAVNADDVTLGTDVVESFFQLFGDIDGDRTVGFFDFARFAQVFGTSAGDSDFEQAFDFTRNGTIDFFDFVAFAELFGAVLSPGSQQ